MRCRAKVVGAVLVGLVVAGCGAGRAPAPEELAARARQVGVQDVALVYVTSAEGYRLTAGGLGGYGDSGFQVVYASGPDDLRLSVERRSMDAASCPRVPVPAAEPARAGG